MLECCSLDGGIFFTEFLFYLPSSSSHRRTFVELESSLRVVLMEMNCTKSWVSELVQWDDSDHRYFPFPVWKATSTVMYTRIESTIHFFLLRDVAGSKKIDKIDRSDGGALPPHNIPSSVPLHNTVTYARCFPNVCRYDLMFLKLARNLHCRLNPEPSRTMFELAVEVDQSNWICRARTIKAFLSTTEGERRNQRDLLMRERMTKWKQNAKATDANMTWR